MAQQKPERPNPGSAYQQAVERTVPLADFSPSVLNAPLEDTAVVGDTGVPPQRYLEITRRESATDTHGTLTGTDISEFLHDTLFPQDLLVDPVRTGKRYAIEGVVGKGATGRVYAMRDNGLDRTVAVKLLDKKRESKRGRRGMFVHEARVTARLEHPNIMPVHDIGLTERDEIYFTMKNVTGCTLGDAIRSAKSGETRAVDEFATLDGRVRIFLKVCDALMYAHSRGYIHQDIKPDNIMLGEYGEVLLLDWGSALSRSEMEATGGPGLVGTPAYMSPEQARREGSDERSDIYCLGATFFHALLLRHPTWADDAEVFWEKKRDGVVDPVTPEEKHHLPPRLVGIALKALEPKPSRRYQTVADLADDLKRYQAGLAVTAHRESPFEAFLRWYGRNRRIFWTAASAVLAVSAIGGLFFREKIKELVTWRALFHDEFGYETVRALDEHWEYYASKDWRTVQSVPFSDSSGWRIVDGALVGQNDYGFDNIALRRRIPGDIRVEWDVTPLYLNQNLNCFIAGRTRFDGYTFHIGGWASPTNFVLTKGATVQILDHLAHPRGLLPNRTYRFRMEREKQNVRLFLDGQKLFDYRDVAPLAGVGHQSFGFENCSGNRIRIDNVRVYYHPLPLKVSPLAAADRYFEKGHYLDAREQYREIEITYPESDMAPFATFRAAQCLARADSTDAALQELWVFQERYPEHELVPQSVYERARIYLERGDTNVTESFYRMLAERFPAHPILRTVLFGLTNTAYANYTEATSRGDLADPGRVEQALERFEHDRLSLLGWSRLFGVTLSRNTFLEQLPSLFADRLDPDTLVARFAGQRKAVARALMGLGHYERVARDFADQESEAADALSRMGRHDEVLERYPQCESQAAAALNGLGRYREVLVRYPGERYRCAEALYRLGRYNEVIERYGDQTNYVVRAAHQQGQMIEVLEKYGHDPRIASTILRRGLGRPDSAVSLVGNPGQDTPRMAEALRTEILNGSLYDAGLFEEVIELHRGGRSELTTVTTRAFLALGREDEVISRFPFSAAAVIDAHMARGEYDSVLAKFPNRIADRMAILYDREEYDSLLSGFPERPNIQTDVLMAQGRYRDVLRKWPKQQDEVWRALLALGDYRKILRTPGNVPEQVCRLALVRSGHSLDSALARYPNANRDWIAEYLYTTGQYERVVRDHRDTPFYYSLALVELGHYDEIPFEAQFHRLEARPALTVTAVLAIRELANGNAQEALRALRGPGIFSYEWASNRFRWFMLPSLAREYAGEKGAFQRTCDQIMKHHRYPFAQMLWYEAALVSGRLTEAEFMQQPRRRYARARMMFLKGLRSDLAGERAAARDQYGKVLELPDYEAGQLVGDFSVERFIRWRIAALDTAAEVGNK